MQNIDYKKLWQTSAKEIVGVCYAALSATTSGVAAVIWGTACINNQNSNLPFVGTITPAEFGVAALVLSGISLSNAVIVGMRGHRALQNYQLGHMHI